MLEAEKLPKGEVGWSGSMHEPAYEWIPRNLKRLRLVATPALYWNINYIRFVPLNYIICTIKKIHVDHGFKSYYLGW